MKKHISFSELKTFCDCSYKHKLQYVDEIDIFEENEFLMFGKAIHKVAEIQIQAKEEKDWKEIFELSFLQYLMEMKTKNPDRELNKDLINEMRSQGKMLSPMIKSSLKEFFGDFEVVATEYQLYEEIKDSDFLSECNFKGFIDLILKKNEKIIIIDFKSCSFGWYGRDRNDKMKSYQLVYYKHFYSQKYNIDPKDIEVYFCLLKRTAKKDNVETFRVTSGEKKINNALVLLKKAINNIQSGKVWKDKRHCDRCGYYNTEFCKK